MVNEQGYEISRIKDNSYISSIITVLILIFGILLTGIIAFNWNRPAQVQATEIHGNAFIVKDIQNVIDSLLKRGKPKPAKIRDTPDPVMSVGKATGSPDSKVNVWFLSGSVFKKDTDTPLPGVSVWCENCIEQKVVYTDAAGYYKVPVTVHSAPGPLCTVRLFFKKEGMPVRQLEPGCEQEIIQNIYL